MARAAVASLMRTIESLLISNSPMESIICDHREELRALHEKVSSLEVFLNNFEQNNVSREMTDFEVEVKEVANAVELTLTEILMERVEGDIATSGREQVEGDIATISRGHSNKGIISSRFFKGISKIWTCGKFPKRPRQVAGDIATSSRGHSRTHEKISDSLQQVGEDIDRVWKESKKIQDKGKQASKESLVQDFSSSTKDILNVKNNMVGRDGQRKWLLEHLTRDYSGEPKVIPIIGMGGIGKTTLVRDVYNDVSIQSRFDVRAWATLSQQPNVKNILLSLLRATIGDTFGMNDEAELADMLQKSLKRKRYLIVMDDIWSSEVWDDLRLCFPSGKNNAGSRILLTTRSNEVARYAGSENLSLQMGFMDRDESWNLFKSVAFAIEAWPSEFETTGKQIAEKCHGLPLTIVVVAGLLKSKKTIEDWESVAKDVKSFVANDPKEQCLDVLGLSYNHLTGVLKACLLYFGIVPEDIEIPVTKLMKLWMAEGFLNLEKDLEGEAEKCLQELIDRCLVLVSEKSLDESKIRSCKVHDLIYDLCLREVQRGNVFVMNDIVFDESDAIKAQNHDVVFDSEPSESQSISRHKMKPFKCWTRREIRSFPYGLYRALLTPGRHPLTVDDDNNLLKRTHSIFFSGRSSTFILKSELIHFKLLKVLVLTSIEIDSFPLQILSLIWLRYLSLFVDKNFVIPPEICRLWTLQTFIIDKDQSGQAVTFPEQIWGLMQLRHLKVNGLLLPIRPSISGDKGENMGFSNIQTISRLLSYCCRKEVILGIRNVKKLGIDVSDRESNRLFKNLIHLHKLESLSLEGPMDSLPATIHSAATLKKLKLEGTFLSWSDLDVIAELPNLEVLKLMYGGCSGKKWNPKVRVFPRLKLLLIQGDDDLKYWKATNDNFPVLERLFIRDCTQLEEIPIEFADIYSLQLIEIKDCSPKLDASAERIRKEQEDLGNNPVIVRIVKSPWWLWRQQRRNSGDDDDDDNDDDSGDDFERTLEKEFKMRTIELREFHWKSDGN